MKSHSRTWCRGLIILWAGLSLAGVETVPAQQAPPAAPQQSPPAAQPAAPGAVAATNAAPAADPAAPPSAPAQRSDADLDALVAPIEIGVPAAISGSNVLTKEI